MKKASVERELIKSLPTGVPGLDTVLGGGLPEFSLNLIAGAGRLLRPGGRLFIYGPFKRDGAHTAPSNAAFDASLRAENPAWGVRDVSDIAALAADAGLNGPEIMPMPANNLVLAFAQPLRQN